MKKVILLTDFYFPKNNANGLCMGRIGVGLKQLGYEVHVIAYSDEGVDSEDIIDGIYVHRVKPAFFYRMRNFYYKNQCTWKGKFVWMLALADRRIRKALFAYLYPFVYPLAAKRYLDKINHISKNIECKNIIAGYNPMEAAVACLRFNKASGYNTIAYFLDTFTMTANARKYALVYNRGRWWEERIFDKVSLIGNLKLYKDHFSQKFYKSWQHKMQTLDIPVDFYDTQLQKNNVQLPLKFIYTGGASLSDRDPRLFISIFNKLSKNKDAVLHFFGKNNLSDYLANYYKINPRIINVGYVSFSKLNEARCNANFMVNIGSNHEIIVPSRLLEYISTGKPIIHMYYRKDDPCISYLQNYPLSLVLDASASIETSYQLLIDFVNKYTGSVIKAERLDELYPENSQKYIAKVCDKLFYEYN